MYKGEILRVKQQWATSQLIYAQDNKTNKVTVGFNYYLEPIWGRGGGS